MAEVGGKSLEGKVAVVTGGASGIGAAAGRLFARHGANVVLVDLNEAAAAKVAEECASLGVSAFGMKMDVTDEASVEAAMTAAVQRFGRIDIVVDSAGISLRHPAMEMPVEVWDKVLAVNVKGTFLPRASPPDT